MAGIDDDLVDALKRDRLASYARLRGGFAVLLTGATYWAAVGSCPTRD